MKINDKKISLSIILIIILCLIVTGIIVSKLIETASVEEEQAWFIRESKNTNSPVRLEDAYIVSNTEGIIEFIYNKETYTIEGNLARKFAGVADILVEKGAITRIYAKPDSKEGILLRYTDTNIILESKDVLKRKASVPIYMVQNGTVKEAEWDSLIVGTSNIKTIMENGQVSAIIVEKEIIPTRINVLLRSQDTIYYQNIYVRKVYENTLVNVKEVLENNNETELMLSDKKGLILCDANNNPLGTPYEGDFYIYKTEEGLVLVNQLAFETYLKYVIPSEMPKSFSHEALKAQAVCARTYAYMQMKNGYYAEYGANLDNTTNYQVYHSFGRYEETDAAVDETKGQVVLYNGEMINCYFFSCSAGVTNDLTVWGDKTLDYIGMRGLENIPKLDLTNEEDFSKFINSNVDSNDSNATYYRWISTLKIKEVIEKDHGKLQSIQIKERNPAGYITKLVINYEIDTITLTNENDIRRILGLYLANTTISNGQIDNHWSILPSACFEVAEQSEGNIILRGGGYGHAIGLSQYGSNKMAEEGKTYEEIIQYYYTDVNIGNYND